MSEENILIPKSRYDELISKKKSEHQLDSEKTVKEDDTENLGLDTESERSKNEILSNHTIFLPPGVRENYENDTDRDDLGLISAKKNKKKSTSHKKKQVIKKSEKNKAPKMGWVKL